MKLSVDWHRLPEMSCITLNSQAPLVTLPGTVLTVSDILHFYLALCRVQAVSSTHTNAKQKFSQRLEEHKREMGIFVDKKNSEIDLGEMGITTGPQNLHFYNLCFTIFKNVRFFKYQKMGAKFNEGFRALKRSIG